MSKRRRKFTKEFKAEIIKLVLDGVAACRTFAVSTTWASHRGVGSGEALR